MNLKMSSAKWQSSWCDRDPGQSLALQNKPSIKEPWDISNKYITTKNFVKPCDMPHVAEIINIIMKTVQGEMGLGQHCCYSL